MPNSLTVQEILAAKQSIFYSPNLFADGRGNLTPEATIAQIRGARFDARGPATSRDMKILDKAMRDLATYLGFSNVNDYTSALLTDGPRVFDRTPAAPVPATATYPFPVIVGGGDRKQISDKKAGQSEGIIGDQAHAEPTIFDTGYTYNSQTTLGAGFSGLAFPYGTGNGPPATPNSNV